MFWFYSILVLLLIALLLWSQRQGWYARKLGLPPVRNRVRVRRKIPVTMPDGAVLLGDHYAPAGSAESPTILIRSPYGRGWESFPAGLLLIFAANRFAERGYHVFVQMARGQYDSGGDFLPFANEKEDGLATLAWLREQPWFNGQVGMWGNSYLGLVQWAVAADPAIKALVPVTTSANLRELIYADDVFALELCTRWVLAVAGTGHGVIQNKPSYVGQLKRTLQTDKLVQAAYQTPALRDADSAILGEPASFFQLWLETDGEASHPYWQAATFKDQVSRTGAAVHLVAGWYDIFIRDQLDDYRRLKDAGQAPYLTIGPWYHTDRGVIGGPLRDAMIWFDAQLKGERSGLRERPVRLFVMGSEEWREMESYPPPSSPFTFYLHPDGVLTDSPPAAVTPPSGFTYDPTDPTPSLGGNLFSDAGGRIDNGPLEGRSDVIHFTSDPLAEEVEIIGPLSATIFLKASTPFTDLFVRLNDVDITGLSLNVCDGLQRITPKTSVQSEGGTLKVTVELLPTAYRFRRGHRLRLLLAGGAHPRWARNLGTGVDGQFVTQEHIICHDAAHPSAITIPRTMIP